MQKAVSRFLKYLQVERNASDYTLKSYREDLTALAEYLTEGRSLYADSGAEDSFPRPAEISVLDLRGYVSALHEAGYAYKRRSPRRLASLRSFFPLRAARRLGRYQSCQTVKEPAAFPFLTPLPFHRGFGPAARIAAG